MAFLIIGKTATDQLNASALAFLAHDDFEDVVAAQLSGGSRAASGVRLAPGGSGDLVRPTPFGH